MPPETEALFADYDAQVHPQVHWMSYSKYILTTLLLNLLYIAFIVAFVLLISAFVDNQPLSFVVSAVLFLMATLLNRSHTMGFHWNLSPFGMNNAFRIVNGSYNVTPLMACAVLCASTFLLLTIGSIYFKKKGI